MTSRAGREVTCDCRIDHGHAGRCGLAIGYLSPSKLPGSHFCAACLPDYRRGLVVKMATAHVVLRCQRCTRPVSEPGVQLCRDCYLAQPRGTYHTEEGERLRTAYAELVQAGVTVRPSDLRIQAGVGWSTAKRFLLRLAAGDSAEPARLVVPPHIGEGTSWGAQAHRERGEPACGPCRQAHREAERRRRELRAAGMPAPSRVAKCGTLSGYTKHKREGEPPCTRCLAARAEYYRRWRAERPRPVGECGHFIHGPAARLCRACSLEAARRPIRHGTVTGYARHLVVGEIACDACLDANRERGRSRRRAAGAPVRSEAAHGTISGFQRHKRAGEPPCDPCRQAQRDYQRDYKRRARARQMTKAHRASHRASVE